MCFTPTPACGRTTRWKICRNSSLVQDDRKRCVYGRLQVHRGLDQRISWEAGGDAMSQQGRFMLLFSLGPVQTFIAQARKTRDLWLGSYLLAKLMEAATEELKGDLV